MTLTYLQAGNVPRSAFSAHTDDLTCVNVAPVFFRQRLAVFDHPGDQGDPLPAPGGPPVEEGARRAGGGRGEQRRLHRAGEPPHQLRELAPPLALRRLQDGHRAVRRGECETSTSM